MVLLAKGNTIPNGDIIMRSRKREAVFMGLGILAGLALSGPTAQAADYLKATTSSQPIYMDGQRVQMEAYSIHGNNFVKLRDIGKAVDFGVTYDATTNSVYLDSTQSYREETSIATSGPTEESVQATLAHSGKPIPPGRCFPRLTVPPAAGPTAGAPTAPAGPRCARTPRLAISHGGELTAQVGSRSAPAI